MSFFSVKTYVMLTSLQIHKLKQKKKNQKNVELIFLLISQIYVFFWP